MSGIEQVELAHGANRLILAADMAATAAGRTVTVLGGRGNDVISAFTFTAQDSVDISAASGDDMLVGGTGDDIFRLAAHDLTGADTIRGRGGSDRLVLTSAGGLYGLQLAGVTGIEVVELTQGTNHLSLAAHWADTAENRTITVIGADGDDSINAWGFTAADHLDVQMGLGDDSLIGGSGDDIFRVAADGLNGGDSLRGGAGLDRLILTSAGSLYGAQLAGVSGIESIELTEGANHLSLAAHWAASAQDRTVTVAGTDGDDSINAWSFTAIDHLHVHAGRGSDMLLGGAGNDSFYFGANGLDRSDRVTGGAGFDQTIFSAPGAFFGDIWDGLAGIEQIALADGANYVQLAPHLVRSSADRTFSVIGNGGDDKIDATLFGFSDHADITAGRGDDDLSGGAGDDSFRFDADALTLNDIVQGNGGHDRIVFETAGSFDFSSSEWSKVLFVEELVFANGSNDILLSRTYGFGGFDGDFYITLNDGDDRLDAADLHDGLRIVAGAGDDHLISGYGSDTFIFRLEDLTSADFIDGGDSYWSSDRLILTTAGHFSAANWNSDNVMAELQLADGANIVELTSDMPDTISDGAGDDRIDASNAWSKTIYLSEGDDTFIGGAGYDHILIDGADFNERDRIIGNGGNDVLTFRSAVQLSEDDFAQVSNISEIEFLGSNSRILLGDTLIASTGGNHIELQFQHGAQADASAVSASNAVTFLTISGKDRLIGGAGADNFNFYEGPGLFYRNSFDEGDVVVGGDGASVDTLILNYGDIYDAALLAGVSGIERVELHAYYSFIEWSYEEFTSPDYSLEITDALVSTAHGGRLEIVSDSGEDVLDASALSAPYGVDIDGGLGDDHLLGGAGQDRLEGNAGADMLTGGAGSDTFMWADRWHGWDSVTDFTAGEDRLAFASTGFALADGRLDTLVRGDATGIADLGDADLFVYEGPVMDGDDLRAILADHSSGGGIGAGLFIAAATAGGRTHIYYTTDASGTIDATIHDIADLGSGVLPSQLALSDFALI